MDGGDTHAGGVKPAWALRAAVLVLLTAVVWTFLLRYEAEVRAVSPGCVFKRLTGYDCAGCGGTRAFFAFLKGEFALSWRMNPLFLTGLAGAGVFGGMKVWDRLPGGRPRYLSWIRVTAGVGWWALGILLAFWILRNLPWWPFTLLAPP